MERVVALVLAGGHVDGYGVLTLYRTKAALPFAGFYRIVDFTLSSLSRSGINRVGLICQYLPASLIEHVGTGEPWGFKGFGTEVRLMPPFVGVGKIEWFRGTADAIYQNLNFVHDWDPSYVIVCSAEHVHNVDLAQVVAFHESAEADLTIVVKQLAPEKRSRRFGYVIGDDGRVRRFVEKPDSPPSDRASIGIYVFNKDVLVAELDRLGHGERCFNLARDIIPQMVEKRRVMFYEFKGYWNYLETIEDYYRANLSLLQKPPEIDLLGWDVVTNLDDRQLQRRPSAFVGETARVRGSLVSPGCIINGTVENSILSPGVIVESGAVVRDSILMHDVRVERGARVDQVVSDKDAVFERDSEIGFQRTDNEPLRLTLVGKRYVVGSGQRDYWRPGGRVAARRAAAQSGADR